MTAPTDRPPSPPVAAVHGEPGLTVPPAVAPGPGSPTPDASGPVLEGPGPLAPPRRKRRPKDIGTSAETAAVRYLRANGWPGAERRALRGTSDAGDITGTPGVAWEVKSRNRPPSDKQVDAWLEETEAERVNARADVGVLVIRRAGFGPASAGSWWAIADSSALTRLSDPSADVLDEAPCVPVRMLLSDLVQLLRWAGYGDPLPDVSDL